MAEKLKVVATPIGNLDDLSPRARDALVKAAVVLAEDTRHSRPLLDRIGSHAKLVSCHQHNELERVDLVIERLAAGASVALISDAGAPSVSDPGGRLVEAVVARGYEVEVLPGPSAVVAALMGAGLDASRFAFLGFLPKKGGARAAHVESAVRAGLSLVIYEAPGRVMETLDDLHASCGPRRVVVGRELTKKFETFHRGVLGGPLTPPLVDKGEAVIIVEIVDGPAKGTVDPSDTAAVATAVDDARHEDAPPKERAKRLAKQLGISTKEAYALVAQHDASSTTATTAGNAASAPVAPSAAPPAATTPARVPSTNRRAIHAAVTAARPALQTAQRALAEAAHALVEADAHAAREMHAAPRTTRTVPIGSDIPGADALMAWLDGEPALPAPLEAKDVGRQLLTTLAALDMLEDALGFADDG